MSKSEEFSQSKPSGSANETSSKKNSRLTLMAWSLVVLTTLFAVVSLGHDPTVGWIFVGIAALSVIWSFVAKVKAASKGGSAVLALVISLGLLVFSVMNIKSLKSHDQSLIHNGNVSNLSSIEMMLELYYDKNGKFPAALTELTEEVKNFAEATVEDFAAYTVPATEEETAWNYVRTGDKECVMKSAPYRYEGKEVTLSLIGKDGEVEVAELE